MINIKETEFILNNDYNDNDNTSTITIINDNPSNNDYISILISDSYFIGNKGNLGSIYKQTSHNSFDNFNYISSFNIFNVKFINNSGIFGGSLGMKQIYDINNYDGNVFKSMTKIESSLFKSNNAKYGGSIFSQGSNIFLINTSFIDNYANISGGAIFINSSSLTLSKVKLDENKANINGG